MSARLYRFGPIWILEQGMEGSHHTLHTWEFSSAAEARRFAKSKRIAIRRAANCDSDGD